MFWLNYRMQQCLIMIYLFFLFFFYQNEKVRNKGDNTYVWQCIALAFQREVWSMTFQLSALAQCFAVTCHLLSVQQKWKATLTKMLQTEEKYHGFCSKSEYRLSTVLQTQSSFLASHRSHSALHISWICLSGLLFASLSRPFCSFMLHIFLCCLSGCVCCFLYAPLCAMLGMLVVKKTNIHTLHIPTPLFAKNYIKTRRPSRLPANH